MITHGENVGKSKIFNWKKYDRFSDWYDYPDASDYYDNLLNYGRNRTVFFELPKIRTVTEPADKIAKHLNKMKTNPDLWV
jgi:hypothetical protein